MNRGSLHVLGGAGRGILLIGGDVQDGAGGDGEIGIVDGVAGTDLGALGVEGDGDLTALLGLLGSASIVNDRLCSHRLLAPTIKGRQDLCQASVDGQAVVSAGRPGGTRESWT